MDLQTLTQLFATSYNADPNVRMAGELEIRKARILLLLLVINKLRFMHTDQQSGWVYHSASPNHCH
jgi:hypothetical protein